MVCSHAKSVRVTLILGVCCSFLSFAPSPADAAPTEDRIVVESPLRATEARIDGVATRLALDPVTYSLIKSSRRVVLQNFSLDTDLQVDLELESVDVFAKGARIVSGSAQGDVPLPKPDLVVLSGQVVGRPESRVFLGLSPHGSNGLITLADETFIISSPHSPGERETVIYNLTTLPPDTITWRDFVCGTDDLPVSPGGLKRAPRTPREYSSRSDAPPRRALVAIETDREFTGDLFGGDTAAAVAYATLLLSAASEIYQRDLNCALKISYLRVWSDSNDPWDQTDMGDQLFQFRNYWNDNMRHVSRHVAHFLSGRCLGGGVAYVPGVCNPWNDYGFSSCLGGYFPYPLEHNHAQNWDPFVVSHELGHNFRGPHTHDGAFFVPPIDGCGSGDCSVTPNGTIMSYCHGCPGGMTNIRLEFHSRMINEAMLPYLDGLTCDLGLEVPRNRYLSFHPNEGATSTAYQVTLTASTVHPSLVGSSWWVQAPMQTIANVAPKPLLPPGECVARLGPESTAAEIDWNAAGCQTLYLTGCPIEPASEYEITTFSGGVYSGSIILPTAYAPASTPGRSWGDTVGYYDGTKWTAPNGSSNFDDIVVAVKTWQGGQVVAPIPGSTIAHLSIADVEPGDTNTVVNFADVLELLLAFQGSSYRFGPADVDGNCP